MNSSTLARHYKHLTGEERFRLVLAASGRGDETECDRLARGGERLTLTVSAHLPYGQAFQDVAFFTYIELLDDAGKYREALALAHQAEADADYERLLWGKTEVDDLVVEAAKLVVPDDDEEEGERDADSDSPAPAFSARLFRVALANGFVLRTKADGWKRFCDELAVPPWLLCEALPGWQRFEATLKEARKLSFSEKGFLKWLNAVRPKGDPPVAKLPFTVESAAASSKDCYRERARWWCG